MTDAPEITPEMVATVPVLTPGRDGGTAIVGALIAAMEQVGAVGKDARHQGDKTGTWNYRSADDVVNAVHPALLAAKVLAVPTVLSHNRNGSILELQLRYTLIAAEDNSAITVDVVSHGMGNTAYTTGAAMSYGLKYALSQLFMIPFDDDKLDLESNARGESYQGAVRGHEQSGPGRFVVDADVALLLQAVTSEGDAFRDRFKAKQAELLSNDYSWSLNDKHKWTYIEWREAMAWVLAHRGDAAEPFNGDTPADDSELLTGSADQGEPPAQQPPATPAEPEPKPKRPPKPTPEQVIGDRLETITAGSNDPGSDFAPVNDWAPPGAGVWTKHGRENGVTMRRLFKEIAESRDDAQAEIPDIKALCERPTLAHEWWLWIKAQGEAAASK